MFLQSAGMLVLRMCLQCDVMPCVQPTAILQPIALSSYMVECSICCGPPMSRFGADAINTPCGHCFHQQCLQPWVMRGNKGCPTCRRDISCLAQLLAPHQ